MICGVFVSFERGSVEKQRGGLFVPPNRFTRQLRLDEMVLVRQFDDDALLRVLGRLVLRQVSDQLGVLHDGPVLDRGQVLPVSCHLECVRRIWFEVLHQRLFQP